eukprot:4397092-Pleurochrysis_carterae.AAC.1
MAVPPQFNCNATAGSKRLKKISRLNATVNTTLTNSSLNHRQSIPTTTNPTARPNPSPTTTRRAISARVPFPRCPHVLFRRATRRSRTSERRTSSLARRRHRGP